MNGIEKISKRIRADLIRMTTAAGSGHLTSSLSAVELMAGLLFGGIFRADLKRPDYSNNDRLIFSKGHAAPLLYALYAATGVLSPKELLKLRQFGSHLEGHPTPRFPYTEVPTGSLGQGLSVALGEALAASMDKLPYRVYCLLGDSEMAEGSVWEAIQMAGFRKVHNLVAVVDMNGLGQSMRTMLGHQAKVMAKRVEAFGWKTIIIDGHDAKEVVDAYRAAGKVKDQPVMIIGQTVKGQGVSFIAGKEGWHGKVLSKEQSIRALEELGPIDSRVKGSVTRPARKQPALPPRQKTAAAKYKLGELISPRLALGQALARLGRLTPGLVVLDGEVKNSTYTDLFEKKFPKRFIEGYIAEQNMIGVATGLSRRGKIPVSATFSAFLTRAFDQLRMASYTESPQVVIGTHPGVHIGQDGASQMGLQDISLFRTLEKSTIVYPADAVAAAKLLEKSLKTPGIAYIRATRADLPVIYPPTKVFTIGGSSTLRKSIRDRATIVAAGVTVHEALRAAEMLAKNKIHVRVIDLYSIKPIDVATLKRAARETKHLIVVEDHYPEGGIAEAIRSALEKDSSAVISLAVRRTPRSGRPEELLHFEGIDAQTIVSSVMKLIR